MKLNTQSIGFYIEKLKNKEYYSFPGFSDAEWICMDEPKIGERTGGHQTYTRKIGDELKEALLAHQDDPSYMKAIPDCIINPTWYGIERMIKNMDDWGVGVEAREFWERDSVTDDLARAANLNEFIRQLREMPTVIIGNKYIRIIEKFLPYEYFIEIPKIDVYLENQWLEKYAGKIIEYNKPAVYLYSAGFAAAPLIARVHGLIPNSFHLDVGSIWDCFPGIGDQRGWRKELYDDPPRWEEWIQNNLERSEEHTSELQS